MLNKQDILRTCSPGWQFTVTWRTRMVPGVTRSPSFTQKPRCQALKPILRPPDSPSGPYFWSEAVECIEEDVIAVWGGEITSMEQLLRDSGRRRAERFDNVISIIQFRNSTNSAVLVGESVRNKSERYSQDPKSDSQRNSGFMLQNSEWTSRTQPETADLLTYKVFLIDLKSTGRKQGRLEVWRTIGLASPRGWKRPDFSPGAKIFHQSAPGAEVLLNLSHFK